MGNIFSRLRARHYVLIAFVVVAVGVLVASWVNTLDNVAPRQRVTLNCKIGSEKDDFLSNPKVQDILLKKYGLEVIYDKMGSVELVRLSPAQRTNVDCLWPSNTSALEIFRIENPNSTAKDEIIFNSPIVLYTWAPVLDGMLQEGVFGQTSEGYYVADMTKLTELMKAPRPEWSDLNVSEGFFDGFQVVTSDPTRSNSGNMFYGLFLNMLNGGRIANQQALDEQFPIIEEYYDAQGMMEESSGILFDRYITQGMGAVPLMANYESLIIEFSVANKDALDRVQDTLRVVYPQPTVYSSHPLIALTEDGERLIEALRDEEIQRLAWEEHGFRTGLTGITNDPAVLDVAGIPAQVSSIINLPQPQAMLDMVNRLQG